MQDKNYSKKKIESLCFISDSQGPHLWPVKCPGRRAAICAAAALPASGSRLGEAAGSSQAYQTVLVNLSDQTPQLESTLASLDYSKDIYCTGNMMGHWHYLRFHKRLHPGALRHYWWLPPKDAEHHWQPFSGTDTTSGLVWMCVFKKVCSIVKYWVTWVPWSTYFLFWQILSRCLQGLDQSLCGATRKINQVTSHIQGTYDFSYTWFTYINRKQCNWPSDFHQIMHWEHR